MIFWVGYRLVEVSDDVLCTIERYSKHGENDREAGGILIGSYRGAHIQIVECTVPLIRDRRFRMLFDRRDEGHQRVALNRWRASRRTLTFVGEWHTHPESHPLPSSVDRQTWRRIAERNKAGNTFFLIKSYDSWWAGLGDRSGIAQMTELH
jgi:integrative and conjugative element protein (TIGR02256 family)